MSLRTKPRLLVVARSFAIPSQPWITRQIGAFEQFEPHLLCWTDVARNTEVPAWPLHVIDSAFNAPEGSATRWLRRLAALREGNLQGAAGDERRRIEELVKSVGPAVILCHFGHTALRVLPVADALGIPLVCHFHGLDLSSSLRNRYYRWSLSRSVGRFSESIVVGSHQERVLSGLGVPPERISRIPCGAPTDQFLPRADYRTEKCRFVAVSRLTPWKGIDYAIRAFARARDHSPMELHVVGGGSEEASLRALVAELSLGDDVVFHGQQSPKFVHDLLTTSDVFVQHSLNHSSGWIEGFGVSIAEASACGLPAVVTDCGGIVDQIIDGENGFVTPQRDWEAMAGRMVELAESEALRARMGKAGRRMVVDRFDATAMAHALEARLLAVSGVA